MIKVDRTTAARAIAKLELQGFIEKKSDPANRKIKRLFPSAKGEGTYPLLKREADYSDRAALAGLSAEEIGALHKLLERVRRNVERDWEYVKKGNKRSY